MGQLPQIEWDEKVYRYGQVNETYCAVAEAILSYTMSAFACNWIHRLMEGGQGRRTLKPATKTVEPMNHFDDLKFSNTGRR